MSSKQKPNTTARVTKFEQRDRPRQEMQNYDSVRESGPLDLPLEVRETAVRRLNQSLADTMTLRDLYKKSHWQVSGPTFYQLHLLFDKHYKEQSELVDGIAERIQMMGGVSLAMAHDVVETTAIPRAPRGREAVPAVISRLLEAHGIVLRYARESARILADAGDDGTNDLLVSDVVRTNEMQIWFLAEHLEETPLSAGMDLRTRNSI
jgi:starvation-inducible DNA-binding protein